MSIIPCGHRIVVKLVALEEIDDTYRRAKAAGIQIPDSQDRRREEQSVDKGFVVSIGPTAFNIYSETPWCDVGDVIAFAKYSGKAVKDLETGEDYLIINDEDVVAILKKGNE